MPIKSRLVVQKYQDDMGHVDRLDKDLALFRLRLKRCLKRYHRAIFMWYDKHSLTHAHLHMHTPPIYIHISHRYIGAMIVNTICIFACIYPGVDKLKKAKKRLGYKHWFQNTLGLGLCEFGILHAAEERKDWAAKKVTKFIRYCSQHVDRTTRSVTTPICRRVLRSRSNVPPKKRGSGGRKKKRKRGPGRTKSGSNDAPPRKVSHYILSP